VGGYREKFQPSSALDEFRGTIRSIVDLQQAQLVERRGGRIPVGGVLPHLANPRGLLIGDAAGAVSPLTAGGLDPCLRLSQLAAQVTHRYLSTQDESHLAVYDGRRDVRVEEVPDAPGPSAGEVLVAPILCGIC
jgi:flavin-dependent dehydrogenase